MPKFLKDVLKPGVYSILTDEGERVKVRYTPKEVAHLERRLKEFRAAGVPVPASWNHTAADDKVALAERAKWNFGHVEDAQVQDGTLAFRIDVPVEDDAKRLPAVRYCSPQIERDYVDGSGRLWPGLSITHVAATANPIQFPQGEFQRIALSADRRGHPKLVRLSVEDAVAEEKDKKDMPEKGKEEEVGTEGGYNVEDALEMLASHDIMLPDDTDDSNFLERLCVVLHALKGKDGAGTDTGEDTGGLEPVQAPPTVGMSADRRKAMNLEARLLKSTRSELEGRITRLKPVVGKPICDELLKDLRSVRLSLDAKGNLQRGGLVMRVEAYERLAQTGGGFPVRLSGDRGAPQAAQRPREAEGVPVSEKQAKEVLDEIDKALGYK